MDKDHRDIARYASLDDDDLKVVLDQLRAFQMSHPWWIRHVRIPENKKHHLISTFLGVKSDPLRDIQIFHRQQSMHSCEWIQELDKFKEWLDSDSDLTRILWLRALPGSGKSVLASSIVRLIKKEYPRSPCHYFFFREDEIERRSLTSLLISLAGQMSDDFPEFRNHLASIVDSAYSLDNNPEELNWKNMLIDRLPWLNYKQLKPVRWVIDGLDICPSAELFFNLLRDNGLSKIPLRVLILSRPTPTLLKAFGGLNGVSVDIDQLDGQKQAIRKFVEAELGTSHPSTDTVTEIAQGNFLAARIFTHDIAISHHEQSTVNSVGQTSPELNMIWNKITLQLFREWKVHELSVAKDILMWATHCRSPLTISQLNIVLKTKKDNYLGPQRITELCSSLIQVENVKDEFYVSLSHRTVKDYLATADDHNLIPNIIESHKLLLSSCIEIMVEESNKMVHPALSSNSFYNYAINSWTYHLSNSAIETDSKFLDNLENFLKSPACIFWIYHLAKLDQLQLLLSASTALIELEMKRELTISEGYLDLRCFTRCATEFTMIWGQFGRDLLAYAEALYTGVWSFFPQDSLLREYTRQSKLYTVEGISNKSWDELTGRIRSEQKCIKVLCTNQHIAIMGDRIVRVISALDYDGVGFIDHDENLRDAQFSNSGHMLVTYGYRTVKVWLLDDTSRHRTFNVPEKFRNFNVLDISFTEDDCFILCCLKDGSILRYPLASETDDPFVSIAQFKDGNRMFKPICAAFSPKAKMLAATLNNGTTMVWNLSQQHLLWQSRTRSEEPLSEGASIAWTPKLDQIITVQSDRSSWSWHFENQNVQQIATCDVNRVKSSPTGLFFVASDKSGMFRILNADDFSLIYSYRFHLGSHRDFTISPDGLKIYIWTRDSCHVWMPECLTRLSLFSRQKNGVSMPIFAKKPLSIANARPDEKLLQIDALAINQQTGMYCLAHTDASLQVFSAGGREIIQHPAPYPTFIRHVSWREDGLFLAVADETRLWVYEVQLSEQSHKLKESIEAKLPGFPLQVLFCSDKKSILVTFENSIATWIYDETSKRHEQNVVTELYGSRRWMNRPLHSNQILGFDPRSVVIVELSKLERIAQLTLSHSTDTPPMTRILQNDVTANHINHSVTKILSSADGSRILFQITHKRNPSDFALFSLESADLDTAEQHGQNMIETLKLPQELLDKISTVLGFVDNGVFGNDSASEADSVLVYLNNKGRLCTIRNDSNYKEHSLILPSHWRDSYSLNMAGVTKDGVILIPRNNEVAAIKFDFRRG